MPEEIAGAIERITYYNEENGYSVVKIMPEKRFPRAQARDGTVTVVGTLPQLNEGEDAQFVGEWVDDSRWGRQFRAEQAIPIAPTSVKGIINYLSSGIVKGIGPRTAEKIVNHLGEQTIAVLDSEPERIHEVPGLKPQLAKNLVEIWTKNRVMRNNMIYLQGLGISAKIAKRIWDEYREQTQAVISNNPYQLAQDVFLIGFRKADEIARRMGLHRDDPHRLRAGLHYALNELAGQGHTYSPREQLLETAAELLGVDDKSQLTVALKGQLSAGKLVEDQLASEDAGDSVRLRDLLEENVPFIDAIYLPRFYHAETGATRRLQAIATSGSEIIEFTRYFNEHDWESFLDFLSEQTRVKLTRHQRLAVRALLRTKVSVLTGGPGTGKTTAQRMASFSLPMLQTVISALRDFRTLQMLQRINLPHLLPKLKVDSKPLELRMAAPTGRAAKQLSAATGLEATTIHRMLRFLPEDGSFEHDENNPLEADLVIIDEASMLDLRLFHSLLKALQPTAHLLLVGDVDQLPSVGAGNVLRDVIDSGIASVTRLDQIFRQDDSSHIVSNAHRINQGRQPVSDNQSNDFYFFNVEDPEAVADNIVEIVRTKLPERGGFDPVEDIQVIAPMYRGAAGVNNLNERLQSELNGDPRQAQLKLGSRVFRVGDKVMQTRNNYDKDVFNGDIGFIHAIDHSDNSLEIDMDGGYVHYDLSETSDLMHAYCISTHRSQGSEYPAVVMPILTQHYMMLQRNLLYTAITRAKRMVVLVGTRKALHIAVNNNNVAQRHSGLLHRLRG